MTPSTPGNLSPDTSSVLRLLLPSWRAAPALIGAVSAATALPLAAPQVTRWFVDDAMGGASIRHLTLIAAGYLVLAVAGQAARTVTAWLAGRLAWDGSNRLRERLTGHALHLDLAFHGRHTPGELIERVDGDVVAVADFVVAFLLDVVAGVLLLAGVVVAVLLVDWRIGLALLAYCLVIGYGMARAQRLAVPSAARSRAASAALFGALEERLAGAEDLRANGAGAHTVRRFHQVSAALFRAEHRDARIGTVLLAGTSVAFAAGTAIMLGLAAWTMRSGALTVGTAVLLLQYTMMVRAPFERLIDQIRQYQAALAGVARIAGLLAERPALTPGTRPLPPTGPLGLDLDGVGFTYPGDDEQVLSGVRLRLAPGETLGLVGRTGSGKTTLARLVLRLHDPVQGGRPGGRCRSARGRAALLAAQGRRGDAGRAAVPGQRARQPHPVPAVAWRRAADGGARRGRARRVGGLPARRARRRAARAVGGGGAAARVRPRVPGRPRAGRAGRGVQPARPGHRAAGRGGRRAAPGGQDRGDHRAPAVVAGPRGHDRGARPGQDRRVRPPRAHLAADPHSRFGHLLDLAGVSR
ncbi:hypothetical protein GCM10020001_007780 [Nonomuraea salmonea]